MAWIYQLQMKQDYGALKYSKENVAMSENYQLKYR